jgi:hypothetical protein
MLYSEKKFQMQFLITVKISQFIHDGDVFYHIEILCLSNVNSHVEDIQSFTFSMTQLLYGWLQYSYTNAAFLLLDVNVPLSCHYRWLPRTLKQRCVMFGMSLSVWFI